VVARVRPHTATAAEVGLAMAQLCQNLDPKELGALLHFIENGDTGTLSLEKDGGELIDARVQPPRPARSARRAKA
jgi:hypothetical protein